jgi:hypothetical protein
MKIRWALLSAFAICSLSAVNAQAASVAVMPVRGVNLSEGQCDAIGVFFSNAFARDAHVAVSSPAETKPVWDQVRASAAAAQRLGASQYVELTAIRLASKVTLAGILYAADGKEVYRAETAASSLDEMDVVSARLARALIWRQPVPPPLYVAAPSVDSASEVRPVIEVPPAQDTPPDPAASRNMFGPKGGFMFPVASGRSISPQMGLQFDARIGPRGYFLEVGAGIAAPTNDDYSSSGDLRVTDFFVEIGGSAYLNEGSTGLYIGGGVAPGLWESEYSYNYNSSYSSYSGQSRTGAMFPVYAQMGINFTRDIRTRIYTELRISQHLLGVGDPSGGTYHPTVLALQMGLGW